MVNASELRCVAAFSDLPSDQIDWFLSQAQETSLKAGEAFVRQGDPANWMFIFLEGVYQWRGEFGGDTVVLAAKAGEISGVYPFSRTKRFSVTGRALTDGRLLRFPASLFPELVQRMPELTARLVAMMSDRIREGTRIEQQRDRLVSMGKLAAGLAHELNNPAAAAVRATSQLEEVLTKLKDASFELGLRSPAGAQRLQIEKLEKSWVRTDIVPPDAGPPFPPNFHCDKSKHRRTILVPREKLDGSSRLTLSPRKILATASFRWDLPGWVDRR